jgi:hypothetical protein
MEIRSDVRVYTGVFLVILAALGVVIFFRAKNPPPKISNFAQCAAAGYKVLDGFPRQCILPNNKIFLEQVLPER